MAIYLSYHKKQLSKSDGTSAAKEKKTRDLRPNLRDPGELEQTKEEGPHAQGHRVTETKEGTPLVSPVSVSSGSGPESDSHSDGSGSNQSE